MTGVVDLTASRFGPVLLEGAARRVWLHGAADPAVLDRAIATLGRLWRPGRTLAWPGTFDEWDEPSRGAPSAVDVAAFRWDDGIVGLEPTRAGRLCVRIPEGASVGEAWSVVDADRQERVVPVHRDGSAAWLPLEDAATSVQIDRTGRRAARLLFVIGSPWHVGAWDPRPDAQPVAGAPVSAWRAANTALFAEVLDALSRDGWTG